MINGNVSDKKKILFDCVHHHFYRCSVAGEAGVQCSINVVAIVVLAVIL